MAIVGYYQQSKHRRILRLARASVHFIITIRNPTPVSSRRSYFESALLLSLLATESWILLLHSPRFRLVVLAPCSIWTVFWSLHFLALVSKNCFTPWKIFWTSLSFRSRKIFKKIFVFQPCPWSMPNKTQWIVCEKCSGPITAKA